MSQSHETLLVGEILREQFGAVVQSVALCLLDRGRASVDELVRILGQKPAADSEWTALSASQLPQGSKKSADRSLKRAIADAILTGVQHNFIGIVREFRKPGDGKILAYVNADESSARESTLYYLDTQRVLLRLRFSKFLLTTKNRFGQIGEAIVDEILTEGRLTAPAVISATQTRLDKPAENSEVLQTFTNLVRSGFIIEATSAFLPASSEDTSYADKHPELFPDRAEQRQSFQKQPTARISAVATDTSALGETPELALYASDDTEPKPSAKQRKRAHDGSLSSVEPPRKRAKKPAQDTTEAVGFEPDPKTPWCINYLRFIRTSLEAAAIQFVHEKFDPNAGNLLRVVFGAIEPAGYLALQSSSTEEPYYASVARLDSQFEKVVSEQRMSELTKSIGITSERSRHYCDILARHPAKLLVMNQSPSGYRVNMQAILNLSRRRLIESIVSQKFGQEALRIFRLLAEKGLLELKQVSEYSMTPSTETKQILFKLLQSNLVHMQPIPKGTGADVNRTFFLWSISWRETDETIKQHLYGAIRKLRSRLFHTYNTFQHLHRKAEEEERLGSSILTETEEQMLSHARNMEDRLYATIFRLDDHLLLLSHNHQSLS